MSQTLTEQYNQRVGANVVNDLFKAITTIQRAVFVITVIAMATSYLHQATFLHAQGAQIPFAALMPVSLDALMVVLMKVASLKGIPARSRWIARGLLLIPASASAAINYLGATNQILRGMFVFVVAAIVIGEIAQGLIKPDFAALEKAADAAAPVPTAQLAEEQARAARRAKDKARRDAKREATQAEAAKRAAKAEAARNRRAAAREALGDVVAEAEEVLAVEAERETQDA